VNNPPISESAGPRVLLVGDASARPEGLERALTGAGFHLVEQEDPHTCPELDAIVITLRGITNGTPASLFASPQRGMPPRIVLLASADPDGPADALALGAADALAAPIHFPELCARLSTRIQEHRASSANRAASNDSDVEQLAEGSPESGGNEESEILETRVREEFARARRYSLSFSLILLGVDDLATSEERLGTEAAARLRTEVALTLRKELRAPDLLAPFSPVEFAIVLPETGESGARQSVLRLRERLTSLPFEGDPRLEPTRFSAGIVTYPHPAALETDDLFAMAEAALMRGRAQAGERIGVAM
jgi:diguanylate cyclase (GGDEF)-like protein